MSKSETHSTSYAISVFRGDEICVTDGANEGDTLATADELLLNDSYGLNKGAALHRMSIRSISGRSFQIEPDSEIGTPSARLFLDCALTFISSDGQTLDALVLIEVDDTNNIEAQFLLPLGSFLAGTGYTLLAVDRDTADLKLAQVACVSFSRGTRITLATGAMSLIEDLSVGDKVLTRDDGAQDIRWIGQTTVRAVGDLAPILISAGTLNNDRDLIVSPDHRFFIYQRKDRVGAGRSELMVKARHLINGNTVRQQEGGFVDYFQLLFDRHQIIYAEGIAAESLLIDPRTRPALPEALSEKLGQNIPGHTDRPHAAFEVDKSLLDTPDAAALLKRASTR